MLDSTHLGILEGLLFAVGDDGISLEQIMYTLDISKVEAITLLTELRIRYKMADSGLDIIEVADEYKMATKKEHEKYLKRLIANPNQKSLSNAALEILAIVSYRQPITRHEIENIRGTNNDTLLRKLLTFSLIEEAGRLDAPGRPILYRTTDDFLDYFGISSLEELPELQDVLEDFDLDEEADLFA